MVVGIEDTVVVSLLSVVSLDVDVVVPISVNQVKKKFFEEFRAFRAHSREECERDSV